MELTLNEINYYSYILKVKIINENIYFSKTRHTLVNIVNFP